MAGAVNILSMKPGDRAWVPVLSGSMAPGFLPGDEVEILILDRIEAESELKPGMIAVFYENGIIYFHRILFINIFSGRIYQKGDGNPEGSWISAGRIIGKVTSGRRSSQDGSLEYDDGRWTTGQARRQFIKTQIMAVLRYAKAVSKRIIKGV